MGTGDAFGPSPKPHDRRSPASTSVRAGWRTGHRGSSASRRLRASA